MYQQIILCLVFILKLIEDKKLKKDIDEAIEKIDQTIEKLLEKKEELLQMKKNYISISKLP
mgnify:CR=1 FL=1